MRISFSSVTTTKSMATQAASVSSATPAGAATTNTPKGKTEAKKDILAIMAAHRIPYAATASLAHPEDFFRKAKRSIDDKGFRFLLILSPCPTGWKSDPSMTVELVRLAVRSGLFPVLEVEQGSRWIVNIQPDFSRSALDRYFSSQRRFQKSGITPDDLGKTIEEQWRELALRTGDASVGQLVESR